MKTIKLMASMELIKLLELVVPMKMEKGVQYWFEWLNWGHGNYGTDGFNQINWSDGTNGTKCVRIDRAAGSVWFHWMKLSDRLKCKHIELIELTICMVRGTESGARIYNKKNMQHFRTQLSQEKWKWRMAKNCFRYRNIDIPFIDIGRMVGVWMGGILCKQNQKPTVFLYISDKNGAS